MSYYTTKDPLPAIAPLTVPDINGNDVSVGDRITYNVPKGVATPNMGHVKAIKIHNKGKRAGVIYLEVDFNNALSADPYYGNVMALGLFMRTYNIYPRDSGNMYRIEKC